MANTTAATSTDPGRVTDPEAVEELCEQYVFEALNWKINDDDEFGIWGYSDLNVFKADEDNSEMIDYDGGLRTREFFRRLSQYVAENETVDIQTTGFMKCRFREMVASRFVIKHGEILHADLGDATPLPVEDQPHPEDQDMY